MLYVLVFFLFFKQKTAYEMRISDWSSDVCSSDLPFRELQASIALEDFLDRKFEHIGDAEGERQRGIVATGLDRVDALAADAETFGQILQIGRASCRERVCQYV